MAGTYRRRVAGITIIDVCRQMRVEPTKELTWPVGDRVRYIWERRYLASPEKDLRIKTCGAGSHCFAIYPEFMCETIRRVIKRQITEQQRQGELFDE
jgi:hypothetical protein